MKTALRSIVAAALVLPLSVVFAAEKTVIAAVNGSFNSGKVGDFPLLVKISDAKLKGFYATPGLNDGAGLRFTSVDGKTEYPFEVDTWNPHGVSFVWVRLPSVDAGVKFAMHYGTGAAADKTAAAKTWAGYDGVWHMSCEARDSSAACVESALNAKSRPSVGVVGAACGTDECGCGPVMINGLYGDDVPGSKPLADNVFTASCWMRFNKTPTAWSTIFGPKVAGSSQAWGLGVCQAGCDKLRLHTSNSDKHWLFVPVNGLFPVGKWVKVDAVYDGKNVALYVNGECLGSGEVASGAEIGWVHWLAWGGFCKNGEFVTDASDNAIDFDECRVYGSAADEARVAADYCVTADDVCDFYSVGDKIPEPVMKKRVAVKPVVVQQPARPAVQQPAAVQPQADVMDEETRKRIENAPSPYWHVTVLDSTHIVVQADRHATEQARVWVPPSDLARDGWKYDGAVGKAVSEATADRAEFAEKLKKGPFLVNGKAAAKSAYWPHANGAEHFEVKPGRTEPSILPRLQYNVYLELAKPLETGKKNEIALPTGEKIELSYGADDPSPLFKVNQVGYADNAAEKYVYLGDWMGPLGPWKRPDSATAFELVDAKTGKVALTGEVKLRKQDEFFTDKEGRKTPFSGEDTYEMDISAAPAGTYFVRVAGVGRSMEFNVGPTGPADVFALSMKGLFQQRCGCAKTKDLTHWTDEACHMKVWRGMGPPQEWEYGGRFFDKDGNKKGTGHFPVNNWQARRLEKEPGCMEELSLPGGWHDAADYDRRPMHMRIVGDLATLYILKSENFTDSQLAVPERGNGIPDILDEAIWGLKHLLKGQQKDGGVGTWIETLRHPDEKNHCTASGDPYPYFLTRATRESSMDYAGYAALLARALEKAGGAALKPAAEFRASAERAWNYAMTAKPATNVWMRTGWNEKDEVDCCYCEDPNPIIEEVVAKAAINLYALTGDAKYAEPFTKELAAKVKQRVNQRGWSWSAMILSETGFTDIPGDGYAQLKKDWVEHAVNEADAALDRLENAYAYRLPYYGPSSGWVHTMAWGNIHPLHQAKKFIAAHAATGDEKYLTAAFLSMDFHCGCNPNGQTWTSGLGKVYPTSYLSLVSVADGIDEYVPGIPPYRNTFGLSPAVSEKVFNWDSDVISKYPILRRWENMEAYSVGASEFTVWETVHDPAIVCGYLMKPGLKPVNDMREPAKDVRTLPGFWALP